MDNLVIDETSKWGKLWVIVRYLVASGGGYAVGKGLIDSELYALVVGLIAIVAPMVLGVKKVDDMKKAELIAAATDRENITIKSG